MISMDISTTHINLTNLPSMLISKIIQLLIGISTLSRTVQANTLYEDLVPSETASWQEKSSLNVSLAGTFTLPIPRSGSPWMRIPTKDSKSSLQQLISTSSSLQTGLMMLTTLTQIWILRTISVSANAS